MKTRFAASFRHSGFEDGASLELRPIAKILPVDRPFGELRRTSSSELTKSNRGISVTLADVGSMRSYLGSLTVARPFGILPRLL